jgi:hypothetical protein
MQVEVHQGSSEPRKIEDFFLKKKKKKKDRRLIEIGLKFLKPYFIF